MALINSIVNGEITSSISIQDRGFHYGDGLFETIAFVNQQPVLWEQHYQRLSSGCQILGIQCPTESELRNDITKLNEATVDNPDSVLKIIVTRGDSDRGYKVAQESKSNVVLLLSTYPKYPPQYWHEGINVRLCKTTLSTHTQLAGLKHLNRLEQVLARQEWCDEFQEGLISDDKGYLVEGVMSNLFIVKNKSIITPCIDKAGVDGIMRNVVLNLCESNGIIAKQDKLSSEQVLDADEVFLTNSIIGIWPVNRIDTQSYSIGETTKLIMQLLKKEYSIDYATIRL